MLFTIFAPFINSNFSIDLMNTWWKFKNFWIIWKYFLIVIYIKEVI